MMIDAKVNVEDMCHNCYNFKPTWDMKSVLVDRELIRTITIECEFKDLCNHLKEYIEEVNKNK